MIKFGGHAMAAGLSLEEARLRVSSAFGELVTEWLDPALQGEVVRWPCARGDDHGVAQMLRDAGRGGRCSRNRCLTGVSACCSSAGRRASSEGDGRAVGGGPLLDGIAFNVDTTCWPDNGVREVSLPTNWISTSFAATAACKYHRQYLANLASVISIKKGVDSVQSRSYHRILTSP
jgi:single-stranded-DNA-specific exonuclease